MFLLDIEGNYIESSVRRHKATIHYFLFPVQRVPKTAAKCSVRFIFSQHFGWSTILTGINKGVGVRNDKEKQQYTDTLETLFFHKDGLNHSDTV